MKKNIIYLTILCFTVINTIQAQFVHPGITHKASDLDRMKAMVEAEIDPWFSSYNQMVSDSKSAYDYTVKGNLSFTELGRDNGVNYSAWNSDIRAAYYNAMRWYIEGDSRHADKAIEIFNAWVNIESVTSNGTTSLSGGVAYIMIEAAEIVKNTYTGWSDSDRKKFEDMLVFPGYSNTEIPEGISNSYGSFYWQAFQGDPVRHGNQGLSGWRTVMAMGIFLDNEIMYDRALRYVKGEPHRADDLAYPAGPNTSKEITGTNDYADTYSITRGYDIEDYGYNELMVNYIDDNGQCQESSRDQQHTAFGIGLLTSMAEMAWNQGEDLYGFTDDRLLLGLEYNMRYNVSAIASFDDQLTPWVPTVSSGEFKEGFDRTGRWYSKAMSPIGVGEFSGIRPVFEMPIAHYLGRGLKSEEEVKWITRARDKAIELSGYEDAGWTNDAIGWGALSARRPMYCFGDPISGFTLEGLPIYAMHDIINTIEAENFDYDPIKKGEGRVYHDKSIGNSEGNYRAFDNVDMEDLGDENYAITSIESGEWLTYTISVTETAIYNMTITYAASKADGTIKFNFAGEDKTGDVIVPFDASNSTGDSDWKTIVIAEDILLNKGVQSLKIEFLGTSEAFKLDNFKLSKTATVKEDQDIQFFTLSHKVVGTDDFNPAAKASSGLEVSYSSSAPSVATVVDGKIHVVGSGRTIITANQIGDASYNPAIAVTQELDVVNEIGGTKTLIVDADSYVHESKSNSNFGDGGSMVTKLSARFIYLKFDLKSIPGPIISTKLRMYQRTSFTDTRTVYDVADDNWVESEITWNNKPAFENERSSIITTPSTWNEWEVSSYVAQEYNNDKMVTFAVRDPADSGIGIDYYSKESDLNLAPELIIEYYDSSLSLDNEEIAVALYPNPIKNILNISLLSANFNLEESEVILSTINGQEVLKMKLESTKSQLDLSKFNSGIYILTIKDSSKIMNKKIVKL